MAYSSSDRTNDQVAYGKAAESIGFAGGEKLKPDRWREIRRKQRLPAMMYAETRNMTPIGNVGIANQTQNFEAVAQYQFDFGLRPSRHGFTQKVKTDGKGFNQDLVNYIDRHDLQLQQKLLHLC